jgi:hypothetical protein
MTIIKKLLYIAIITALPMQSFAKTEYKTGGNPTDCLATDRPWPDGNSVYFCGTTSNKCCAGVCHGNTKHTINYGKSVDWNGARYWCCGNATANSLGEFKMGQKWIETRTQVKQLPDGNTCTYTQTRNVCDGKWIGEACTSPCKNPGEIYRNKECIKPCESPLVFESKTSNQCVECETTPYQKATDYDSAGVLYCLRCDPETQFVQTTLKNDTPTTECVSKASFLSYTKQDMKKCWRCNGFENFKKCLQGQSPHKFCPENNTRDNSGSSVEIINFTTAATAATRKNQQF